MPAKRQHKIVERPKTRKELRKDKRLQKKANRVHFHKRKKELRIEYRARLKQKDGKGKRNDKPKEDAEEEMDEEDPSVNIGDDEEIESDFELSDEEMESKMRQRRYERRCDIPNNKWIQGSFYFSANKPKPVELDRLQQDQQREKQKQKSLEKEMRKQRVRQLKTANEEEDKVIRKLEKQLKIDKTRSEKHVPKMFNDGLEYALELCLPENIQKMYTAAKEAAQSDSDDGFDEDLQIASGGANDVGKKKTKLSSTNKKTKDLNQQKADKRMAKLRKVEDKFFDDLDSDLSLVDSEFERSDEENESEQSSEGNDFDLMDSGDEESEDDDVSSDEAPEERPIGKSAKAMNKKKKFEVTESDSELSGSDNESDSEPSMEQPGKFVRKPASDSENDSNASEDDFSKMDDILAGI